MEIVLNDMSLNGQFQELDDFIEYVYDELAPILDKLIEKKIPLLKKEDFYDRKVTNKKSLNDILISSGDPALAGIRNYISQLGFCEPYWNDDLRTLSDMLYEYPFQIDEPNCFTEAMERGGVILTIRHDEFPDDKFECKGNGADIPIVNIKNVTEFLYFYLDSDSNEIRYVLEKFPVGNRNIHLAKIDGEIFEYRLNVSEGRIFRLLFIQRKDKLIFLNGFIKKQQKTPKNEIVKAKSLVNAI